MCSLSSSDLTMEAFNDFESPGFVVNQNFINAKRAAEHLKDQLSS